MVRCQEAVPEDSSRVRCRGTQAEWTEGSGTMTRNLARKRRTRGPRGRSLADLHMCPMTSRRSTGHNGVSDSGLWFRLSQKQNNKYANSTTSSKN